MYPRFVVGTNGPFGKRQMEKRVILLIETYRLSCWPTGDLFPLAKATPRKAGGINTTALTRFQI
jgi:hypothetical protein